MSNIAVITTFPDVAWEVYGKQMLQSFVANWPTDIPLMIQVDDDLLVDQIQKIVTREGDVIAPSWLKDHADFVARNQGKDDPQNYRKMAVRFCHKIFAIKRACDSIMATKASKEPYPRYLIWLDADVFTLRKITHDDLKECLPKEGDAVSYMGRKDWDHSECGWLAFDLDAGGEFLINQVHAAYVTDTVFKFEQWHDSWLWDKAIKEMNVKATNLTPNAVGMEVWQQSPMGKWSEHHKGPAAKAKLAGQPMPQQIQPMQGQKVIIQTKNAIPHEEIRAHIAKNQTLITKWIKPCEKTDEEITVVSAGPMLVAEDVRPEAAMGKKIIAVKNALVPLKKAGIKPWACILLDPRPHVADFISDADPDILWFVASQVDPMVTMELLARGCTVWGYHAAVGAGEDTLTAKQAYAVVAGGSATATRGLFTLNHLGFHRFNLYGYDLCIPDKPDLAAKDEKGQPKFLEMSIGINDPHYTLKRCFWSEPQLIAQFEEINELIKINRFELRAHGHGIVPFMLQAKNTADLRRAEFISKINNGEKPTYDQLLKWNSSKKTKSLMQQLSKLLPSRRRQTRASSF